MNAPVRWQEEPDDIVGLIRAWRERGESFDGIARALNSPVGKVSWPAPTGAAEWSGYLVRTALANAGRT